MSDHKRGLTQKTQPKEGEPVEIPIPTREAVLRDLMKAAAPPAKEDSSGAPSTVRDVPNDRL